MAQGLAGTSQLQGFCRTTGPHARPVSGFVDPLLVSLVAVSQVDTNGLQNEQ